MNKFLTWCVGKLNAGELTWKKMAASAFLARLDERLEKLDPQLFDITEIFKKLKNKKLWKQMLFYATRWQLSTPTLWFVIWWLGPGIVPTIIANAIGAAIFFWVDRVIFNASRGNVQEWELKYDSDCDGCGDHWKVLKRLRYDPRGYDRRDDPEPQFLCALCSMRKLSQIEQVIAQKGN